MMGRSCASVAALTVLLAVVPCSSFAPSARPPLSSRCSLSALSMHSKDLPEPPSRRTALLSLGAGALGLALRPSGASAAEEAGGPPAVCQNILGCEVKGELRPPEKKFKSILEEEEDRARAMAEQGRKDRQEKLDQQVMVARGQFAAIKKGRNELEKDVTTQLEAAVKAASDTAEVEKKAWEDVRRMTRLYDTALRKDGMFPAMKKLDAFKVEWERKPAEEFCKTLNESLKTMDRAGRKYDAEGVRASLASAIGALDSWLELAKKLDEVPALS